MDHNSSAYKTAKNAWRQRNSDGLNCYDEAGALAECQTPPTIDLTDSAIPTISIPGRQNIPQFNTPTDNEYVARAILHRHSFGVTDPG